MSRKRLHEIDIAKGLAIFLVVFGHVVARESPLGNEWYVYLKFIVYKFHMPFFMFLSGAVFAFTYVPIHNFLQYRIYILKKTKRLIPGFLLIGFVILTGKLVAGQFIHVDNPPNNLLETVTNIFINPSNSVASSLWYIYVLFEFYFFFPLLLILCRQDIRLTSIVAFVLHLLPFYCHVTSLFLLDRFCEYALFFSLGGVGILYRKRGGELARQYNLGFVMLFFLSFLIIPLVGPSFSKSIIGLCAIPSLYGFCLFLAEHRGKCKWLMELGEFSFTIYLLNTICIGTIKGVLFKFISWDYINFLFFFPILLLAGILGPIWTFKFLLARIPFVRGIMK